MEPDGYTVWSIIGFRQYMLHLLTYIQSPYSARTEPLQSPYRARTEPAHKYQHPAHTAQDHQQDFVIDLDNLSLGRWRCAGYWYLWVGSVRALCGLCKGSVRVLYGLCLPPASGAYLMLQRHDKLCHCFRTQLCNEENREQVRNKSSLAKPALQK